MASATVVGLAGQLALCPAVTSSSAAARRGSSSRARLLLGARALPQLQSTTGFAGRLSQGSARQFSVVAKASETQAEASEATSDLLKSVQESDFANEQSELQYPTLPSLAEWEKVDDKLAIGGLGVAGLIVLWASSGLISAIDKLPLLPGFFEFVGIAFSGWFTYRYLLFKPDREELLKIIDEAKAKITGQ